MSNNFGRAAVLVGSERCKDRDVILYTYYFLSIFLTLVERCTRDVSGATVVIFHVSRAELACYCVCSIIATS